MKLCSYVIDVRNVIGFFNSTLLYVFWWRLAERFYIDHVKFSCNVFKCIILFRNDKSLYVIPVYV
jgi:hypothetical protein